MLRDFSEQIATDLNNHQPLTDLLDAGAVSALISEEEDGESFCNYYLKKNPSITKDGASEYQVIVESWSYTYTKSVTIADAVTGALSASINRYEYLTAESEPVRLSDAKQTYIVTKQIFNIKQ